MANSKHIGYILVAMMKRIRFRLSLIFVAQVELVWGNI